DGERGSRAHRADHSRRGNEDRHVHAQPGSSAPAWRRGAVHLRRPAGGARAGRPVFQATGDGGSRRFLKGRIAMDLKRRKLFAVAIAAAAMLSLPAQAQDKFITVASTTSTENSGLFKHILPIFEKKTGIQVRVIAQGTGQALDTARRGDADVVFVHARAAEEKFISEGHGVKRHPVMYNDFVLIGPKSDPAKVKGMKDITAALQKIKDANTPFVSR